MTNCKRGQITLARPDHVLFIQDQYHLIMTALLLFISHTSTLIFWHECIIDHVCTLKSECGAKIQFSVVDATPEGTTFCYESFQINHAVLVLLHNPIYWKVIHSFRQWILQKQGQHYHLPLPVIDLFVMLYFSLSHSAFFFFFYFCVDKLLGQNNIPLWFAEHFFIFVWEHTQHFSFL